MILNKIRKDILSIVITYMVVAGLWIFFSDRVLSMFFGSPVDVTMFSIMKGWFFVLVTGFMLYGLVYRQVTSLEGVLKEKDSLLSELNHRVNNTLQLISNLIDLQRRRIGDRTPEELFNDLRDRIRSIALAYDKLYLEKGISNINLRTYVSELAKSIFFAYNAGVKGVRLKMDVEPIRLDISRAVAVGLIINEIVGNSLKYAFKKADEWEVSIILKQRQNGRVELTVGDNGGGLLPAFDPRKATTLGMQLIYGLAERQLDGKIGLRTGKDGTAYTIVFKNDNG